MPHIKKTKNLQKKMSAFEQACRAAGLKLTHQRLEIYRELAMSSDHPSAESLYKRLKKKLPTISQDTIYRTLSTLEEKKYRPWIAKRDSRRR